VVSPARRRIWEARNALEAIDDETIHGVEQVAGKLQHLFGGGGKLRGTGCRL